MKAAWIACLLLVIAPSGSGCAHETTVTTTRTCEEPDSTYDFEDPACGKIVGEVTIETDRDGCHGLLSYTFVVVGEVIALPFRVVEAAFDVIL